MLACPDREERICFVCIREILPVKMRRTKKRDFPKVTVHSNSNEETYSTHESRLVVWNGKEWHFLCHLCIFSSPPPYLSFLPE